MDNKEFKRWISERDKAIVDSVNKDDLYPFKTFYKKWTDKGYYDRPLPNDKVLKISVYKSAMELLGVDFDTKLKASQWLTINGFNPYIK